MIELLKPFLARIAGSLAGFIATYLSAHEIMVLSQDDLTTLISFLLLVFSLVYGIVHKIISKKTNPTDSAITPSKLAN
jgi:hypothetical protein